MFGLAGQPVPSLFVLALWLMLRAGIGSMFRYFRNYGFVLADYTAAIIVLSGLADGVYDGHLAGGSGSFVRCLVPSARRWLRSMAFLCGEASILLGTLMDCCSGAWIGSNITSVMAVPPTDSGESFAACCTDELARRLQPGRQNICSGSGLFGQVALPARTEGFLQCPKFEHCCFSRDSRRSASPVGRRTKHLRYLPLNQ